VDKIGKLQQRVMQLGNTKGFGGQYIFAGQNSGSQPFTLNGGGNGLTYSGDTNNVSIEVGPNQSLTVNTQADKLFQDAYTALENLKNDLAGGNIPLLSGQDIPALQKSMDAAKLARGNVGSSLQFVQEQTTFNQRRIDEATVKISDIEDVDLAESITKYQLADTAYKATLQSIAMADRYHLMDFI
jgi:flagellar hook-associated protein 3 FlgL